MLDPPLSLTSTWPSSVGSQYGRAAGRAFFLPEGAPTAALGLGCDLRHGAAMFARFAILAAVLALAACGDADSDDAAQNERDPAIVGALSDPIMADPDLTSQNRGNSALQGGGPPSAEVPLFKTGPEESARARSQALDLVGGKLASLSAPDEALDSSRLGGKLTASAIVAALPELGKGCGAGLDHGFVWAARLPAAVPIYPRGHARQSAGSDATGCRIRVVNFVTPAAAEDVLSFYATLAGKAGLTVSYRLEGEDKVLRGKGKGLTFAAYARSFDSKLTELVLVTREP